MTHPGKGALVVFTSLPLVGGHTTITVGLIRLLRPHFKGIHVIAKELPGHGVSRDAVRVLESCGATVYNVRPGLVGSLQLIPLMLSSLFRTRFDCCLLTIDMGRLSPILARLFFRNRRVYYHIKHELTLNTLRLLEKVEATFSTICFISAATQREFASVRKSRVFPVVIQPSELQKCHRNADRPDRPISFGFVGRLTKEKGADVLLSFFKTTDLPCELFVAGNGEYAKEFQTLSKKIKHIHYLGSFDVEEREVFLARFFSAIDYLLVPTQNEWEGTPTVILEALQFGVPTLATACGGTVGFALAPFDEGGKGVVMLVSREDFLSQLEQLVKDGPTSTSVAERAQLYYQRHFANCVIESQWLKVLGVVDSV